MIKTSRGESRTRSRKAPSIPGPPISSSPGLRLSSTPLPSERGVYGAARVDDRIDEPDVISFDMGGTTAKTSLIEDGKVSIETDYWLESSPREEGYPLKIPVVDIIEIGAGGGSIG